MVQNTRLCHSLEGFWGCFFYILRHKILKVIVCMSVFLFFSYNVYSNVAQYQLRHMMVEISESKSPARFPPVTLCPYPAFDPFQLVSFGLNISVDSYEEFQYNIENLIGIERSLTGRHLVEKAAWQLHDLVQEVTIGNTIHESYDREDQTSSLWHRSFTPMGPCWTFTAPPAASLHSLHLSIKIHKIPPGLQSCKWVEEGVAKQYSGTQDCLVVERHCNTSCNWERYIHDYFYWFVGYLTSVFVSYEIHKPGVEKTIYSSHRTYELTPYEVISDLPKHEEADCEVYLQKLLFMQEQNKAKCKPIYEHVLDDYIKDLCVTEYQQFTVFNNYLESDNRNGLFLFEYYCKSGASELRWKLKEEILIPEDVSNIVNIQLTSSSTLQFYKRFVYPLGKLLEDTGGSLGLFLGISLLDVWLKVIEIQPLFFKGLYILNKDHAQNMQNTYPNQNHINQLCTISGMITLAVPFCVHCGIIIERYKRSSDISSVSMDGNHLGVPQTSRNNLTLEESVLAYMASRPLGCQLLSLSSKQNCMLQCLMKNISHIPINLIYVESLPFCQQHQLTVPKIKYIMQNDLIYSSLSDSNVQSCEKVCSPFNSSDYHINVPFSLTKEASFTLFDIVCSLGGIVGLYFGFSMQGLLNLFQTRKSRRVIANHWNNIVFMCLKSLIVFSLIMFCTNPLHKYFLRHPIYTTSTSQTLTLSHLPAMTLCVWPPFNVSKLLTVAGLENAYHGLSHLNAENRHDAISDLIQNLDKINGTNTSDPLHLWMASAWDIKDLNLRHYTAIDSDMKRTHHYSLLNRCQSYYFEDSLNIKELRSSISTVWEIDAANYDENTMMNVLFHNKDDSPPLSADVHRITSGFRIKLERISRWEGIHGKTHKPGECVLHCLEDALLDQMECCLPWEESHRKLEVCNMTQFTKFLSSLWHIKPDDAPVYKKLLDSEVVRHCRESCQAKSEFHYMLFDDSSELNIGSGFSFNVEPYTYIDSEEKIYFENVLIFQTNTYEEVTDTDGYPTAQLISELGGIVGMTIGASLFSLLLTIVKRMKTQHQSKER